MGIRKGMRGGGGEEVKHLIASCCENWDKLWLDGSHGLSTDITYQ